MSDIRTAPVPVRHHWMTACTLLLLGGLLALGLSGALGGLERTSRVRTDAASLELRGAETIRNGEYLELTILMTPRRDVTNAVMEIDAGFWRNVTVNTMIPAPEKEELKDGVMRFEFGPLNAGESATIKIDGQVNPHRFGRSSGTFVFLDGERKLTHLVRKLSVIP